MFGIIKRIKQVFSSEVAYEKQLILQGQTLAAHNNLKTKVNTLSEVEFSVFSQFGDDGIIQYLVNNINIPTKTFIEFGVENYKESNTRFLLFNNNWSGLIIDGSLANIKTIKKSYYFWKYNLQAIGTFITKDNINKLISNAKFEPQIGLLHIDIDGNDYWIWKAIKNIEPIIVIMEYNSLLGYKRPLTIPYNSDFVRSKAHYSNLYAGSSLLSLYNLAKQKGYSFLGCNSAGNNAYFVKTDFLGNLNPVSVKHGYVKAKFKEGRNKNGTLTLKSANENSLLLKGMTFYNTEINELEKF